MHQEFGKAWLNYKELKEYKDSDFFKRIYVMDSTPIIDRAVDELKKAIYEFFGMKLEKVGIKEALAKAGSIILGLINEEMLRSADIDSASCFKCGLEGYIIKEYKGNVFILAEGEKGILYGAFHLIRNIMMGRGLKDIYCEEKPDTMLRMLNHWDNMDGSIERGYSGDSFFFEKNMVIVTERTKEYARLLASIGINATVINNVNVKDEGTYLITDRHINNVIKMADIFREYGITLYLSINYAAPMEIGGLETADPLDATVGEWWKKTAAYMYDKIPDFGGFLVKADSENRPGPFTYGRNHADGANILAKAVAPFGGKIIWRCFVYNCKQDWRDKKTDRARAAYDNFMPLDGLFEENVILQIKNGPMDFQVREPITPLFGGLKKTNQILEVQIAQEYTGQQRHICYLLPMFREVLDFHTYNGNNKDSIADIISGNSMPMKMGGMAAVTNTGNDYNWTGHDFAAANWYGYGRLAWQLSGDSEEIAKEWTMMTFGNNEKVVSTVVYILMNSWKAYEKYTSPLGIGWMVSPNHHYGPNVEGYEYDMWGTYHRADRNGVGVDRTSKGTGYATQYNEPNASMYADPKTCPEELLLFFHYVTYDTVLKSGKTLIQHIYDTHFEGADEAADMLMKWQGLKGMVAEDEFERVEKRMSIQADHSKEWRDRINTYFYRMSGVTDNKGRTIY